ncbi:MAG: acetolactate synthase large subunit [Pseudomonadota bacterium]
MKASDLFVRCLEAEGVERIYGVPGEENADFLLSLESSSIEFILTRHEQAAAFMAAAEGKLTGKAGVCLGTLGPGATNLITGVADGNMDRAPLLVITGQGATTRQHKESHQIMDVVDMYRPVTKWSHAILDPGNIPEIVRKAVKLATTEKPGATHIELAEDIAAMSVEANPLAPTRVRRPVPDDKIMDQAWDLVRAAKRPLIIAGNGAIRTRASKQLRRFCDATGIGVLMTFMAKGAVARTESYCLYTVGMGQKDIPLRAIEDADLILTLGYDMVEYPPSSWNPDRDKTILHLDFLPAEIDAHYSPDLEIVGDLAHGLWALNERIARDGAPAFDLQTQADVRAAMQAEFDEHAGDTTTGSIRPQKAIHDIREALGPGDLLFSGVGAHKMWIARHYQADEPGTCFISNGFCSMGMALPGAIAAARLHPDKRIIAVVGDGDMLMNVQDMETAKRLGSNLVAMVWEDHGYGLIEWKQEQEFDRHTDLQFGNPDWVKLAESFGWSGHRCENAADLQTMLASAFDEDGPSLIVIPIDYSENMKLTRRLGEITCRF